MKEVLNTEELKEGMELMYTPWGQRVSRRVKFLKIGPKVKDGRNEVQLLVFKNIDSNHELLAPVYSFQLTANNTTNI